MEKAMATHSSILAWRIPWMEEPGGLHSAGSLSQTRQSDFIFTFTFILIEDKKQEDLLRNYESFFMGEVLIVYDQ